MAGQQASAPPRRGMKATMDPTTNQMEQDMTKSFPNPWVDLILEQMWIVRQTTAMVARSIDSELLLGPAGYCRLLSEPGREAVEIRWSSTASDARRMRNTRDRQT